MSHLTVTISVYLVQLVFCFCTFSSKKDEQRVEKRRKTMKTAEPHRLGAPRAIGRRSPAIPAACCELPRPFLGMIFDEFQ